MALVGGGACYRIETGASTRLASVGLGTQIAIVAGRAIRFGRIGANAGSRIAVARVVALIERRADYRIAARATACLAGIGLCTQIPVIACRTIGFLGIRAVSGGRVAGSGIVAGILGSAHDGILPCTNTNLAGVGLGAHIAVVA
jgi:hypothetical protein